MLVTVVEAAGRDVSVAQLCAQCGAHRERLAPMPHAPDAAELEHLAETAFG
jgi:hypothetical protein